MYIARKHRNHNLFFYLMAVELPFTIIILTFTGIASHNRYRTKLWQDGADNGFNSSPNTAIYAAANYRPYTPPRVWSDFTEQWNLVIAILSTFILITKFPLHILHILYPAFSVVLHAGLIAVYVASAVFQSGRDMSDPKHPQPGVPWYLSKNCSVAAHKSNISYCRQAVALFAFVIIMCVLYFAELVISVHSCFITKEERAERDEEREEKKVMKEYEDMVLKSPSMIPMTPGVAPMTPATGTYPRQAMPAMTPRNLAFNRVDTDNSSPSTDLPFREHFSAPNPRPSFQQVETNSAGKQPAPQIYFPPPPKKAAKN